MRYSNENDLPLQVRKEMRGLKPKEQEIYLDIFSKTHDRYIKAGHPNAEDAARIDANAAVERQSKEGKIKRTARDEGKPGYGAI